YHPAAKARARAQQRQRTTGAGRDRQPSSQLPRGVDAVVGRNAVLEVLRAELPTRTLHLADSLDADDRVREIIALASEQGIEMRETPRAELARFVTEEDTHQGVVLLVPEYEYSHPHDIIEGLPEGTTPLLVALDGITDPHNLGAIIRSVAAF